MKKLLPLALFCACSLTAAAQKTFTVASYNIDGLGEIINSDGPGSDGTKAISAKIAEKGWDIFGVCEDFKYNDELLTSTSALYDFGTYRELSAGDYAKILIGGKADTDGLNVAWKKGYSASEESWTAWNAHKGGLSDQANDCIDKGFRHYAINLGDVVVDVYHLHMEAGGGFNESEEDNPTGYYNSGLNEHSLNAQRQLTQLVNAIKKTDNKRPIIVMGDTNCRFTREDVKTLFVDALNADKRFTVNDSWVEYCKADVYPANPSASLNVKTLGYVDGETVDKIFYINNTDADKKLTLDNFKMDTDFIGLADHLPAVAQFTSSIYTDEEKKAAKVQDGNWSWTGEAFSAGKSWYLLNEGRQAFLAKDETTIADVNNSEVVQWTLTHSGIDKAGEVKYVSGSTTYNMWMGYNSSTYKAGINTKAPWGNTMSTKSLTIKNGSNAGTYSFGYKPSFSGYKYFQAQESGKFKGGDTNDKWSNWFLISPAQKAQYDEYMTDYADALEYVNQEHPLPEDVYTELLEKVYEEVNMNNEPAFHEFVEYIRGMEFKDVTITTADYSTLCLPWEGDVPAGVTVYYGTNFNNNGDMIHLEEMNGNVVPKNTGVVLYSDVDKNTTFRFWKSRKTPEADQPANILLGTNDRLEAASRDQANNLYYALSNKTSGVGFYEIDEAKNVAIPANRAYLVKSKSAASSASAILFSFDDEDYLEEIVNVATDENEGSVEAIYNAAGARVSRLQEGVNIIRMSNGAVKKVFVK